MNYKKYNSPLSYRYESALSEIWSEEHKRIMWRMMWTILANAEKGLVTEEQVEELYNNMYNIDIEKSLSIEKETKHDLMAEIKAFANQCPKAKGIIHLGATSSDIEDNTDAIRISISYDHIKKYLKSLISKLINEAEKYKDLVIMGYTHIQPAEPTTLGYRISNWIQDLVIYYNLMNNFNIKCKGFKGAIGTSSSYKSLNVDLDNVLYIHEFDIATQISSRTQEYIIISFLSGITSVLSKMALDIRIMQSKGEVFEPKLNTQVGSSAMPYKRNPIDCEKICSLSRLLSTMPQVLWQDVANNILERSLDDSANRRFVIPEAFMICDVIIKTMMNIMPLQINLENINTNLKKGGVSGIEVLLMELVKAGANRQEMHERLRVYGPEDTYFEQYLSRKQITECLQQIPTGDAISRTEKYLRSLYEKDF